MAKKRSKYIPAKKLSPVHQSKRLDELSTLISNLDKTIKALSKSHDIHISYLGNFARHDIKNSIQSMDSILSTNSSDEITEEHIVSLKTNLKVIRETIENFSKLVPYSQDEKFTLNSLISAVELLNRSIFYDKKIEFIKEFPKEVEIKFSLPFQSILQMLNNLIINSIKSLEEVEFPKIKLTAKIEEEFTIEISDNGNEIEDNKTEKVFEFGYSTTGGSGIGLYHAKYLCDLFEGKIELNINKNNEFKKSFLITLPIIKGL